MWLDTANLFHPYYNTKRMPPPALMNDPTGIKSKNYFARFSQPTVGLMCVRGIKIVSYLLI